MEVDVADLRAHVKYSGGYADDSRCEALLGGGGEVQPRGKTRNPRIPQSEMIDLDREEIKPQTNNINVIGAGWGSRHFIRTRIFIPAAGEERAAQVRDHVRAPAAAGLPAHGERRT